MSHDTNDFARLYLERNAAQSPARSKSAREALKVQREMGGGIQGREIG